MSFSTASEKLQLARIYQEDGTIVLNREEKPRSAKGYLYG
jgi:hypothetical protein